MKKYLLGLNPENITAGSNREACLKCPTDEEERFAKINYMNCFWKQCTTGCPKCGRRRRTLKNAE